MVKSKGKFKMPSASFTSSRSYVRRSRRKGANRISLPSRSSSGKLEDCFCSKTKCLDSS
jgi:F-box protein 11